MQKNRILNPLRSPFEEDPPVEVVMQCLFQEEAHEVVPLHRNKCNKINNLKRNTRLEILYIGLHVSPFSGKMLVNDQVNKSNQTKDH